MGSDYTYTAYKPGVYFSKCPLHQTARMGGDLIQNFNAYKEEIDDKTLDLMNLTLNVAL